MNLPPFELERYFARYEFTTRYLLCSSDCESMTLSELLAFETGAAEGLQDLWLGYTESQGDPALRGEITGLYESVSADQVLVHTGAEEAIFAFMSAVLEPSDHIVVQTPCYQSLKAVAETRGVAVTQWAGDPAEGWALDPDDLKRALRPDTKAVVLNCPHNPTGYLMPRDRLEAVVETARRHGLWLFSDEVYRGLEYDAADRLPAACDAYEKGVSLGVLSKTYGLAGLRIGWIATRDRAALEATAAFKDYLSICNAAPSEYLARIALRNAPAIAARNLAIISANLDHLDAFFARQAGRFDWRRPRAGPIAFPALRDGAVEEFCARIVEQAEVLLMPGTVYHTDAPHFRIGFGRRNLPEALGRLEAALAGA
ncbi:MAG: aminotransferase class I/II-fold pyridoxal phosphate-dependent enzyme [Kiloniellales bacterium]|nr:aminotransferase class I/II-fold pyridoxal phosphate-dependent enzyme [Kiloniellales bacterium]